MPSKCTLKYFTTTTTYYFSTHNTDKIITVLYYCGLIFFFRTLCAVGEFVIHYILKHDLLYSLKKPSIFKKKKKKTVTCQIKETAEYTLQLYL